VVATRRGCQEFEGGRHSATTGGAGIVDEPQAIDGDVGRGADDVLADQCGLSCAASHAATAIRARHAVLRAEDRDAFSDVEVFIKRTGSYLDGIAGIGCVDRGLDGHACFNNQDAVRVFHHGTGVRAVGLQAEREVHGFRLVGEEEGEVLAIVQRAAEGVVGDFPDAVAITSEGRREGDRAQIVHRRGIIGVDAHGFAVDVGAGKLDVVELLVVVDIGRIERDRAPRVPQCLDVMQSYFGGVGDGDAYTGRSQTIGGNIRQGGTQNAIQIELGAAETLYGDVRDAEIFQPRIKPIETVSAGLQAIGVCRSADQGEVGQARVVGGDENAVTAASGVDDHAAFALTDDGEGLDDFQRRSQGVGAVGDEDGVAGIGRSHRRLDGGKTAIADEEGTSAFDAIDDFNATEGVSTLGASGCHLPARLIADGERIGVNDCGDHACGDRTSVVRSVDAIGAQEDVIARVAAEGVMAIAAREDVCAVSASQDVVATTADQKVDARAARKLDAIGIARQQVGLEGICIQAKAGEIEVAAEVGEHDLVPGRAAGGRARQIDVGHRQANHVEEPVNDDHVAGVGSRNVHVFNGNVSDGGLRNTLELRAGRRHGCARNLDGVGAAAIARDGQTLQRCVAVIAEQHDVAGAAGATVTIPAEDGVGDLDIRWPVHHGAGRIGHHASRAVVGNGAASNGDVEAVRVGRWHANAGAVVADRTVQHLERPEDGAAAAWVLEGDAMPGVVVHGHTIETDIAGGALDGDARTGIAVQAGRIGAGDAQTLQHDEVGQRATRGDVNQAAACQIAERRAVDDRAGQRVGSVALTDQRQLLVDRQLLGVGAGGDHDRVAVGGCVDSRLDRGEAAAAHDEDASGSGAVDDFDTGDDVGAFGAARGHLPAGLVAGGERVGIGERGEHRDSDRRRVVGRIDAVSTLQVVCAGAPGQCVIAVAALEDVG